MPRLEITLPPTFLYSVDIPVRVSDLNYGNHVGHDSILTIMQEARVLFYRKLGFRNELSFEGPVGQVIADVAVIYKRESFLGDVLTCSIGAADFSKYGFDLIYVLMNKETGAEVARGKTGIVCFDYDKRKIASIPLSLASRLER